MSCSFHMYSRLPEGAARIMTVNRKHHGCQGRLDQLHSQCRGWFGPAWNIPLKLVPNKKDKMWSLIKLELELGAVSQTAADKEDHDLDWDAKFSNHN